MRPPNLVGLAPLLEEARKQRYAVGGFNFCNAETAQAIVEECSRLRSPALLMIGPWEIPLLGPEMIADMVAWLAARTTIPVCLHLDHAADVELVSQCIEAGFTSVMMDASRHDFERNVSLTRSVVEMARAKGVDVEGELGSVGRVDSLVVEWGGEPSLTDPASAAEFVERTGIQALAVAIGNAHGVYQQRPALDFERLEAVAEATSIPLVLHGGSGTPPDQLRRVIELGITKVNVATELSRAYLGAVQHAAESVGEAIWYAHALTEAKAAVAEVVRRWVGVLGSGGTC
jgi:tagatose 1,6-diphosphate aldolase GatY/KbaY